MILTIAGKELREVLRDGRARLLFALTALLIAVAATTSGATSAARARETREAHARDEAAFLAQGEKTPHAAAHFGRIAHKPIAPLSAFDPGVLAFVGQAIWLEAHSRNPAMFRAAEDAPELTRLWSLDVAGILTVLVPLFLAVAGHGLFAAERERRTIEQLLAAGASFAALCAGKLLALASIGILISWTALFSTIFPALSEPDVGARALGLAAGYAGYAIGCAAFVILISAIMRTTTAALLLLLAAWAGSTVVLPRIAASAAARLHPLPEGAVFWADTKEALRARRPARESARYREVERRVIAETSPRTIGRVGLSLEVSERLDAEIYAERYRELEASSKRQLRVRRWFAVGSPAIALHHFSSALSGTDLAAHLRFANDAEEQRARIVRTMNEAQRGFDFVENDALWAAVPRFEARTPPASFAFAEASPDLLLLIAWMIAACFSARRAALRLGRPS